MSTSPILFSMGSSENLSEHLGAMAIIFVISLLAVSFPTLSQKVRFLSIPKILFFIGKHFGTGVILSTAFCHLLQDSFESLTSDVVKKRYPGVGDQTGLIILASLVFIFLVEYVSTSYVDHLHEEPNVDMSESQTHSGPEPSFRHSWHSPTPRATPRVSAIESIDETSPLLSSSFSPRYSHDHSQHPHDPHTRPGTLSRAPSTAHYLSSVVANSPRYSRSSDCFYIINDLNYHLNNGEYHLVGGKGSCVCVCVCPASDQSPSSAGLPQKVPSRLVVQSIEDSDRRRAQGQGQGSGVHAAHTHEDDHGHDDDKEPEMPTLSRKRQIVGILVLQLGIMIHSLVIGLTLSITTGAEFTTLVTAIIFHQLFEGLSLGIRIAAIPTASSEETLPLNSSSATSKKSRRSLLQPVLTILFAITTPLGIAVGMLAFTSQKRDKSSEASMLLSQGLMSAVSAGMLIYAATVEMMAGDFVFGNLGGTESGSGGHGHSHGEEFTQSDEAEGVTLKRRILAVGSLFAGVAAMGLIGLGE